MAPAFFKTPRGRLAEPTANTTWKQDLGNRTMSDTYTPVKPITAVLVLASGDVFYGQGIGHVGEAVGEVCFNTAMTGYQEILTDPSYAAQIICCHLYCDLVRVCYRAP